MTTVVEARGLSKRYRRVQALTDCTLSIPAGQVVGLVGPNGAGKLSGGQRAQLALTLATPSGPNF